MPKNRRDFVKTLGFILGTSLLYKNTDTLNAALLQHRTNDNSEDFWAWVQNSYTSNPNIVNLNNGGVNPQPKVVQEAMFRYTELCNEGPAYFMWRILDKGREPLRQKLARLAGCLPDEIAINRNTTEAIDTVIMGLPLSKGDEVVLSKYDYPHVINAWKLRVLRDGIIIKWVDLPVPAENDDEIVSAYEAAFTPRTRIVNITHIINWNGQILPVRKISRAAHKHGIEVIVDAAHSFAHIDFNISDLDCDYLGTSLHKWLGAPFGTGMLYVKKNKIKFLLPLHPNDEPYSDDIRKFEHLGTRSFPAEQAIGEAINFHNAIGSERKEKRLRFLKDFWVDGIKDIPRIKFYTSLKPDYSCGLFTFALKGMKASDLSAELFSKYKLYTTSINWEKIHGVRVTPNVYTTIDDLDRLIDAINKIARK